MLLDVIRHGVTATNLDSRFNAEDEPLLHDEVQRLRAATIPPGRYGRVYVSPLRRCIETAEALGLTEYKTDVRLCERRLGVFEGLTPFECRTRFCEEFEALSRFDAEFAPQGGESRLEHFSRIAAWLQDACRTGDARVLAITHGGTLDFLYRLATGHPLHGGERIYAGENAAISTFQIEWPQIELLGFSEPLLA